MMEFSKTRKAFNRYLLASLAIHVLGLFMVRDYFTTVPSEAYQDLEVELQPEEIKPPVPLAEKKPLPPVRPKPPRRVVEKIPEEVELPPRAPDDEAKLSMYKDGSGVRGKPKKHTPQKKESPAATPKKKTTKKQVMLRPGKKTAPSDKTKTSLPEKNKTPLRPFKTEDMFVRMPPSPAPDAPQKRKGKLPDQIMANLDKYIDTDKFDDSELFGDSMLTFADENFRYFWYGRIVKKKVVDGWYPPTAARLGLTGKAVVTFNILTDGSVDKVNLQESTGNKSLDRASLNAIKSASPFPKLPDDYEYNKLGVVFSFWYNLSRSGS